MNEENDPRIPNSSTVWHLWYTDMFDRDAPRSLQSSGENIVRGLYSLWFIILNEGILDNGCPSFSYFYLTWGNTSATRIDIAVDPLQNFTLLKLRRWAGLPLQAQQTKDRQTGPHPEEHQNTVILKLAQWHDALLQKSARWKAQSVEWSAESRELLAHLERMVNPDEL